eukprot:TRINITY_DN54849_c0_g1_i2.p1 TRINITY_DN54849_c0_g1~~TRINITY_DN54849_c0_g1_i2.p1  ORF type:complete len:814 (-),score=215.16 TRINITY_DN54849_c0_g1_i2:187-2628(-)
MYSVFFFFFQAEDGIRDAQESRGLGDVYKRQAGSLVVDFQPHTAGAYTSWWDVPSTVLETDGRDQVLGLLPERARATHATPGVEQANSLGEDADRSETAPDVVGDVVEDVVEDVVDDVVEDVVEAESPEVAGIRARLVSIYEEHNPSKLGLLDGMMTRYRGQENKLLNKVLKRYCPEEATEEQRRAKEEYEKYAKAMMFKYALFRSMAPDRWRFTYWGDEARTASYDGALTAAVSKGCTVLDVGVGSGLIGMMAARAGATVVSLEASKPCNAVVQKIVKANALEGTMTSVWAASDSITCKETAPQQDHDQCALDRRASVVCTEIVEPALLGERLTDFVWLGQAKSISTESVQMIPARARVWIAPIECPIQPISLEMSLRGQLSGLDLSEFDKFRRHKLQPICLKHIEYKMLADPKLLAALDFSQPLESANELVEFVAREGSSWNGIAMWHELDLDATRSISCAPSASPTSLQAVVFLPDSIQIQQGETMSFRALHDTKAWQFEWPIPIPDFPEIQNSEVLRWHWAMLMDGKRNHPYDLAIQKAVSSAERVLDIGSGTGLLSMFAARAGAQHITTVEGSEQMGGCAARCIAANGYEKVIHPLQMMSTEVVVGEHMEKRADLCISEIVDCGLLGEWCLPSMQHAREHLLTPEAQCIPCGATVHAFLIEMPRQPYAVSRPLDTEAGFDMADYNTYAYGPQHYEQFRLKDVEHTQLTEEFDVWDFDLTGRTRYTEQAKVLSVAATQSGRVDGVVFYFTLNLDEEISISTAPWVHNCWTQSVTFFEHPIQVEAGQEIELATYHKVKKLVWSQPKIRGK